MKSNTQNTWQELADALGFSVVWLRRLRAEKDSPKNKDLNQWQNWLANRAPTQGQKEGDSMAELKIKLMIEKTRKEAALAGLREIELRREEQGLVPESVLAERIVHTLSGLRRLLDALPRGCAAQLNPTNPQLAEIELRRALDERIYAEMVRIINRYPEKPEDH